jgi:hypothetical protein
MNYNWTHTSSGATANNQRMNPNTLSKNQAKRAAHFFQTAMGMATEKARPYIQRKLVARYPQLQNTGEQEKVIEKVTGRGDLRKRELATVAQLLVEGIAGNKA